MKKFTDIPQFRNVIQQLRIRHDYIGKDGDGEPIYKNTTPYPTLKFKGTVKLHGTNAGIVKYADGTIEFQSRENVLSLEADNAGFMREVSGKNLNFLFEGIEFNEYIAIYGEWCGGNIQKGVAINGLPKMFVVFACKVDGNWIEYKRSDHTQAIYNILDFPTYEVTIDFNVPELSQNKIIEMTEEVEKECPVGKFFGVSGVGEGIVFSAMHNGEQYMFKSKGTLHQKSKVTTLKPVDTDKILLIKQVAEAVTPEWRLEQMFSQTFDLLNGGVISRERMGDFIRSVISDVLKEDIDIINTSGLTIKDLSSEISKISRDYFFKSELL